MYSHSSFKESTASEGWRGKASGDSRSQLDRYMENWAKALFHLGKDVQSNVYEMISVTEDIDAASTLSQEEIEQERPSWFKKRIVTINGRTQEC